MDKFKRPKPLLDPALGIVTRVVTILQNASGDTAVRTNVPIPAIEVCFLLTQVLAQTQALLAKELSMIVNYKSAMHPASDFEVVLICEAPADETHEHELDCYAVQRKPAHIINISDNKEGA